MNNAVNVHYVPEEEKLSTLERRLELERKRKAKRTINWESIGQKCLGFLLLLIGVIAYKYIKFDVEFTITLLILCVFIGLTAILCSGSIFYRKEV